MAAEGRGWGKSRRSPAVGGRESCFRRASFKVRCRTHISCTGPQSPAPLLGIACQCARIQLTSESMFLLAGSTLLGREMTSQTRLFVENDLSPASTRCSCGATNLDDLTSVCARAAPSFGGAWMRSRARTARAPARMLWTALGRGSEAGGAPASSPHASSICAPVHDRAAERA